MNKENIPYWIIVALFLISLYLVKENRDYAESLRITNKIAVDCLVEQKESR